MPAVHDGGGGEYDPGKDMWQQVAEEAAVASDGAGHYLYTLADALNAASALNDRDYGGTSWLDAEQFAAWFSAARLADKMLP